MVPTVEILFMPCSSRMADPETFSGEYTTVTPSVIPSL
jgi:hypothetical protein